MLQKILTDLAKSDATGLSGKLSRKMGLAAINKMLAVGIPFIGRSGFKILEARSGYTKCSIPLKGNGNHIGTMYAGAMFTVAEVPGGVLAIFSFDDRYLPILKEMNVKFLRTAGSPVTVEFQMSDQEISSIKECVDSKGKQDFVLEGELKDKGGNIVATSRGVYQIRLKNKKL